MCAESRKESMLVTVTGYRDSGKTTAVERIVRELTGRGYRIGTFKHCHHGFDLDQPGKDSWRHRHSGTVGTVLMAPTGFALVGDHPGEDDPRELMKWLLPDVDLVLAEGFHWLPTPRIEIAERDGSTRPAHTDGEAVASLRALFNQQDIIRVCDLLEKRFLGHSESRPVEPGG